MGLVGLVGHDVLNLHSLLFHIWPRSLVGILSEVESECFPGATITLVVVLRDGDGTHEENSVDRQPQNFPQIMIIKHKYKYKYKYKYKAQRCINYNWSYLMISTAEDLRMICEKPK